MMYCSKCGKQNNDNAAFCSGCGIALNASSTSNEADISDVQKCPHCGTPLTAENILIHSGINVCRGCGCKADVTIPSEDFDENYDAEDENGIISAENLHISDPERVYLLARDVMLDDNLDAYTAALADFNMIPDYKNSSELAEVCRRRIAELTNEPLNTTEQEISDVQNNAEADASPLHNAEYAEETPFCSHCGAALTEENILQYGEKDVCRICGCVTEIPEYFKRRKNLYTDGVKLMQRADSEKAWKTAAQIFQGIGGYKDADSLAAQCLEKAEICRKDEAYNYGIKMMQSETYQVAITSFKRIPGWKDSEEQIKVCENKIEELRKKEEAARIEAERLAEEKRIADEIAAKKRKKAFAIGTPIVCVCIALIIVVFTVIIPTVKYNSAVKLFNAGQYAEAAAVFNALDFKDSAEKVKECNCNIQKEGLKKIYVGKTVKYGFYEQDNDTSNGEEEIEWKILAIEDDRALLISEYALDCQQYNSSDRAITWENCSLRKWLNENFLNTAFSSEHQKTIFSVLVEADKNPKYDTNPGNATNDKVFLLSAAEAEKYFTTDESRKCAPTAYAKVRWVYTSDYYETASGEATCWWWLRSPGSNQSAVAGVYFGGSVDCGGRTVNHTIDGVRPAIWIDITGSTIEEPPVTEPETTEPVTEPPTTTKKAEVAPVPPVSSAPAYSKQIIHFNTANQNMTLYTLSGTSWQKDMENIYFTYGKGGKTSSISEGDDKSPLGVYDVGFYIGMNKADTDLPFRAVHTNSVWVCDPDSYYYNVFTDESKVGSGVDYEQVYDLYYADGGFNYQLYFEQNGDGLTPGSASYGAGSFLTVCGKNKELKPTYGCIDISGANMERLLSFLDADLNPVVVIE